MTESGALMDRLPTLAQEFWAWTGLPQEVWGRADIGKLPVPPEEFPGLDAMRKYCTDRINTDLTKEELENFILCMAVDNEDEEILDACKAQGTAEFLAEVLEAGVDALQPMARWQMAELLRRGDIPNRAELLRKLCRDPDEYVRKRAENLWAEMPTGEKIL